MITLSEPGEYGPFTIDATSDDVGLLITSPGVVLRPGSRIKNARRHGILIRSRPGLDIAGVVLHSYEVVGSGGHGVQVNGGDGNVLINVSAKNNCLDTTAYPISYSVGALQFSRNIAVHGQFDQQMYVSSTTHRVFRSTR